MLVQPDRIPVKFQALDQVGQEREERRREGEGRVGGGTRRVIEEERGEGRRGEGRRGGERREMEEGRGEEKREIEETE